MVGVGKIKAFQQKDRYVTKSVKQVDPILHMEVWSLFDKALRENPDAMENPQIFTILNEGGVQTIIHKVSDTNKQIHSYIPEYQERVEDSIDLYIFDWGNGITMMAEDDWFMLEDRALV